jgi:hypothetical protein
MRLPSFRVVLLTRGEQSPPQPGKASERKIGSLFQNIQLWVPFFRVVLFSRWEQPGKSSERMMVDSQNMYWSAVSYHEA